MVKELQILYRATKEKGPLDKNCGFHVANDGDMEMLSEMTGRKFFPHRIKADQEYCMVINTEDDSYLSTGNEMEREQGYSVKDIRFHIMSRPGNFSPALTTLKQYPEWRELVEIEPWLEGWCLNTHGPHLTGIDSYFSWYKRIVHLCEFAEKTDKPVIITEAGVGQSSLLNKKDLLLIWSIHKQIFGDRMIAFLVYDSAIVKYNDAWELFKVS